MKKLKDIFYDKNDILIALIILVLAAGIILWRVQAIMDYPAKAMEDAANSVVVTEPEDGGDTAADGTSDGTDGTTIEGDGDGDGVVDICAVYVNYGDSLETIGQNCVTAGLIGSVDDFIALVNQYGVSGSIQAGQHFIPANATNEELIYYLTQTGV